MGPGGLSWRGLPRAAQLYVCVVIAAGAFVLAAFFPHSLPRPVLFAVLLLAACLTAIWKVNLPISLVNGSTLSMAHAAALMSILLLGPRHAVVIAVSGVIAQCTLNVRQPYPLYRTVFSAAAEAIAMAATGLTYGWLGGPTGSLASLALAKPLVGIVATYFVVNTGLIAGAIAASSRRPVWQVWREDFLWSGASYMVAASAGAFAAVVIDRGEPWKAVLMLAPIYFTFLTYQLVIGRLDVQKRHITEAQRLRDEAVDALRQARQAEQALAEEKQRLAVALVEMTRLQDMGNQLLAREHAARASAEQANRLKDQFLAIVSHELRTPLNAILGWADLLRRGTLDSSRRDRACQAIYDSAKRQARLIDELLDVARIMSGKLPLELSAVDVRDIIGAALEAVQPEADRKHVHIEIDVSPGIGTIRADGARLQQIVLNLLTNAVKFSADGGAVRVGLSRTDTMVDIIVTDTGQGISRDFLPFVFEPFRQADASTTRRHGGLGLGLSIVKHLVEAHGGTVSVDSAGEGFGSAFTVRLPIVAVTTGQSETAADDPSPSRSARRPEPTVSLEGLAVLVVDDDDQSRAIVAEYLHDHQAVVLTAASAGQAIEMLQRERVDVLLADIAMPGEDGYSLIREIRRNRMVANWSIPAAALTSLARDEDRQHALQAGFQLHISKPVDPRSLIEAVASLGRMNQSSS
jgi:signal transduction histidine kinase/CheY-like chemotaxis protein